MSQSVVSAAVKIGALRANIIDKKINIFCPMVSLSSVKRFRIICVLIFRFILYTNNSAFIKFVYILILGTGDL